MPPKRWPKSLSEGLFELYVNTSKNQGLNCQFKLLTTDGQIAAEFTANSRTTSFDEERQEDRLTQLGQQMAEQEKHHRESLKAILEYITQYEEQHQRAQADILAMVRQVIFEFRHETHETSNEVQPEHSDPQNEILEAPELPEPNDENLEPQSSTAENGNNLTISSPDEKNNAIVE